MTIDFFAEFLTLAETHSYGITAERHYISIATLTRHMHSLEEYFGTSLFYRQGNKSVLTKTGKTLIPYAQTIVAARDSYREMLAPTYDRPELNISVATTVPLSFYGMTDLIEKFQRAHSINRIDVCLTSIRQVEDDLLNGKHDFAIVWHQEDLPYRLSSIPLKKIEAAALMPASHHLATKASVQISDLNSEPLLLLDNISAFYNHVIQCCRDAGFSPVIRATVNCGRNIEDLVSGNFGIGLLPVDTSLNLSAGIMRKPISPSFEITLDIIYNPAGRGECATTLMKYLCAAFSDAKYPVRI